MTEPWLNAPRPPRRWQREAHPIVLAALRAAVRGLLYACTGAGKSVLLSEVVHTVLATMRPGYVVVLVVPTQALVVQLADTIAARVGKANVGVYYGRRKIRKPRRVHVVCLDSLERYAEWSDAQGLRTALCICDEAHRAEAYADRIDLLRPSRRLGVTATPYLSDGGLTQWDRVVYQYRLTQAIQDGVLVPARRVAGWGDCDSDVITRVIEVCEAAGPWTIVDAGRTIDACEAMASDLRDAGIAAEAIHSRSSDRDGKIQRFTTGETSVLCQVDMLSEGVDIPPARNLVLARRMSTAVRMVQLVGRVLRTHPGKTEAVIYDLLDQLKSFKHLDRDAALDALEAEADREARELTAKERREMEFEEALPLAVARKELDDWTMGVADGLRAAGVLPPLPDAPEWAEPVDRSTPALPAQVAEIERRSGATRWMDSALREAVKPLIDRAEDLTYGAAADLLDIMREAQAGAGRAYAEKGDWNAVRKAHRIALPEGLSVPSDAVSRIARRDFRCTIAGSLLPECTGRDAGGGLRRWKAKRSEALTSTR